MDLRAKVAVAILTRAPSRGGKSRLFQALGRPPDATLLAALLLDTLDGARTAGAAHVIAVEPAEAAAEVRALVPGDVQVVPQPDGTLGDRMRSTMQSLLASGASIAVLIGSDLPDIRRESIEDAVSWLARHPQSLVLGPAADGGYYLIAASHVPDVFDGIEWGGPRVLAQTQAAAAARGIDVHLIAPVRDVDTPDDLRDVKATRTKGWVKTNWRIFTAPSPD